ncbi:hypothetical protein [Flindersiella endophytica]
MAATLLLTAACGSGAAPTKGSGSGSPKPSAEQSQQSQETRQPDQVTEIPAKPRLTAEGRTSQPPWQAPIDAQARVAAAGLPMLGAEGQVEHIHAHLDVIVNGEPVEVPANLGIDLVGRQISPLHTHDTSGVVHIESPVKVPFSLGQFMTEWDVALTETTLGGLKGIAGKQFRVYVDGKPYSGNAAAIILQDHQEIALVYGTAAQQADPPSTFDWSAAGV